MLSIRRCLRVTRRGKPIICRASSSCICSFPPAKKARRQLIEPSPTNLTVCLWLCSKQIPRRGLLLQSCCIIHSSSEFLETKFCIILQAYIIFPQSSSFFVSLVKKSSKIVWGHLRASAIVPTAKTMPIAEAAVPT